MRTVILHRMRVRKRLYVSVLGGKQSIYFSRFRKYFGILGVFVKQIVILNIVFGFVVLNSIWEHGLKTLFDNFSNIFKKCPRSVNNSRTEHLGAYFWDCWSPYVFKNPSTNHVFVKTPSWRPFFFMFILFENCRFGKPFKIQWASRWDLKSIKWHQKPSFFNFLQKHQKCTNTFEILKSKSTVYPPKQTRTDVSGHASGAVFRCASFI